MRVRGFVALLVTALAASCGGRAAPTTPTVSAPRDLAAGSYTLLLNIAPTGLCFSAVTVPVGSFSPSIPVRVGRDGARAVVLPEAPAATFRMDLQLTAEVLAGTARGDFRVESGNVVSMSGSGGAPDAIVSGVIEPSRIGGRLEGFVSVGGVGCISNEHTWQLATR